MEKVEKELLLKDLCARLPYKPKIQWDCADYNLLALENCEPIFARIMDDRPYSIAISKPLEEIKPYLRPMSSMTQEEIDEYDAELDKDIDIVMDGALDKDRHITSDGKHNFSKNFVAYFGNDWLNAHHFDYRGLIEKGLALEAPEGICKTE